MNESKASDTQSECGATTTVSYQRLPISVKRERDRDRVRERPVSCPACSCAVMPVDLMAHIEQRCVDELPAPHPSSRWLTRVEALRLAPGPALDRWLELELLRARADGALLQRDLVVLVAWARRLGCL